MRRSLIAVALLVVAIPARANQPPGPGVLFPEIAILPLMVFLTAVGGGYAVLKKSEVPIGWKIAGAILLVFFSATNEFGAAIVAVVFGVIAIVRSAKMIGWGVRARSTPRPAELDSVHPTLMITAGTLLLIGTAFLITIVVAFVGFWVREDEYRLATLRQYLAAQQVLAGPPSPERSLLEPHATELENDFRDERRMASTWPKKMRIEKSRDGRFVIYLLPNVLRWPFPPFDQMVSAPSYRADSSGAIRMMQVHAKDALCPAEAPVVDRAGPADLARVLETYTRRSKP